MIFFNLIQGEKNIGVMISYCVPGTGVMFGIGIANVILKVVAAFSRLNNLTGNRVCEEFGVVSLPNPF